MTTATPTRQPRPPELSTPLTALEIDAGYADTPVLRGVSCSVAPGSVTTLLGPNGAGKSTLVRVLLGVLAPRRGSVELDGVPLGRLSTPERASRLAFVPQSGGEGRPYSALQAVRLGRLAIREPMSRTTLLARSALARVGLADRADHPLGTLSAGQQQRVMLARALAQLGLVEPGVQPAAPLGGSHPTPGRYLLADEPIASMDPRHALVSMEILRCAARSGVGVLVVMHDFALACRCSDQAILLGSDGVVAASGPTAEVLTPAALERVFAARFSMVGGGDGRVGFPLPHGLVETDRDWTP